MMLFRVYLDNAVRSGLCAVPSGAQGISGAELLAEQGNFLQTVDMIEDFAEGELRFAGEGKGRVFPRVPYQMDSHRAQLLALAD